jgi:hypothetical protein
MHPTQAAQERWIVTHFAGARSRAARPAALSFALCALCALFALLGADAAQANSLTTAVSQGARATLPMTITASGSADPTATLRVYVQQPGGTGCAGGASGPENAQAEAAKPGSTQVIAEQPVGPFSYSATYRPPVAGSYLLCAYLFGASNAAGASQSSTSFSVFAAPPPPPAGTNPPAGSGPGAAGTAPRPTRCVVPTLKGRTYLGARLLIRRAGCSVGIVYRPDRRTKRIREAQGKVLRVASQYPRPHSVRRLHFRLMIRLAYVNPPRRSSR